MGRHGLALVSCEPTIQAASALRSTPMARPSGTGKLAHRIGARIRSLREEAGVTQERLAWTCDISKAYLSQVEAGKRLPSLTVLAALAARMGAELSDLLALDQSRPRIRLLEAARRGDRAGVRDALRELKLAGE